MLAGDLDTARAGSIGAIDFLRHDALGPEPAGVREDDRAVLDDVFIEAQQLRQRGLSVQEFGALSDDVVALPLDPAAVQLLLATRRTVRERQGARRSRLSRGRPGP
jgi:hypothetical protein